ncbi:hypothetical protein F5B19DRAFT_227242 [Rostrohypoxylon terebratum]|nr:hypothetical protein F5B19DRAFT_227242 [Rostrohypoxylon terebratum]
MRRRCVGMVIVYVSVWYVVCGMWCVVYARWCGVEGVMTWIRGLRVWIMDSGTKYWIENRKQSAAKKKTVSTVSCPRLVQVQEVEFREIGRLQGCTGGLRGRWLTGLASHGANFAVNGMDDSTGTTKTTRTTWTMDGTARKVRDGRDFFYHFYLSTPYEIRSCYLNNKIERQIILKY